MTDPREAARREALEPCPFCGGRPFFQNGATAPNGHQYIVVWCADCAAVSRDEKDDAGAAAAWNRRAGDGKLREALEITRMQLRVRMEGKIALTDEKWLSYVEAALSVRDVGSV